MRRVPALLVLAMAVAVALTGCGPTAEPYETAVPSALLASDLGITAAYASSSIDGLSVDYSVIVTFDRASITSDDLRTVLELVVENTPPTDFHTFELTGLDGSASEYTFAQSGPVDEELGFTTNSTASELVSAPWDDVVEFFAN